MKKIYFLSLMIFSVALSGYAQKLSKSNADFLELKELSFDFGKIPQGKPVNHNFEVVNKGTVPLLIETVEATCGCTTPVWSNDPITAGGKSDIRVGFNASSVGPFKKTITIVYNEGKIKTLVISGEVYPSPTTSAPVNASLSLIKQ